MRLLEMEKIKKVANLVISKEEFLESLNLLGQEMLQAQSENKYKRVRQRRTIANPIRYNNFLDPSAVLLSMRKSKKIVEKVQTPSENLSTNVIKKKSLNCDVCEIKDFNLICETCKTKYHADCIKVTGSQAPKPDKLLICPKCVQTEKGVIAMKLYLKNKAEAKTNALTNNNIKVPEEVEKSKEIMTNCSNNINQNELNVKKKRKIGSKRKKANLFPHKSNETCHSHQQKSNPILMNFRQQAEKPLTEAEIKKTILSMSFAAKSVLEKGKNKIECHVQSNDINVNVQMQEQKKIVKKIKKSYKNNSKDNQVTFNNITNNDSICMNNTNKVNKLHLGDPSLSFTLSPITAENPPPLPKVYQNNSKQINNHHPDKCTNNSISKIKDVIKSKEKTKSGSGALITTADYVIAATNNDTNMSEESMIMMTTDESENVQEELMDEDKIEDEEDNNEKLEKMNTEEELNFHSEMCELQENVGNNIFDGIKYNGQQELEAMQ